MILLFLKREESVDFKGILMTNRMNCERDRFLRFPAACPHNCFGADPLCGVTWVRLQGQRRRGEVRAAHQRGPETSREKMYSCRFNVSRVGATVSSSCL